MIDIHTIKLDMNILVLLLSNFSLYANGRANFYKSEATNDATGETSSIFSKTNDAYCYFNGGLTASYRTRIADKPLILTASMTGDGWENGFEKVGGIFSTVMILKNTPSTMFSIGLLGMTLYNKIPAVAIIAYSHKFNPKMSIDIALPSRAYLRHQFNDKHRLSLGAQMDNECYYMKSDITDLPKTSFYSETTIKSELVYEYIINNHFYLIARGGVSTLVQSGLYNTNRKVTNGDPLVEFDRSAQPFFNLGFSYNLLK